MCVKGDCEQECFPFTKVPFKPYPSRKIRCAMEGCTRFGVYSVYQYIRVRADAALAMRPVEHPC